MLRMLASRLRRITPDFVLLLGYLVAHVVRRRKRLRRSLIR
jgi:hypothetical protein